MKKVFSKALLLISILILCVSVAACSPVAGKSAYEIACENGFTGTVTEWLESLSGSAAAGKSAYDIACENGYTGTVTEWLESLAGSAASGKSAYEIACENGFTGTETEWLASLAGSAVGKSAYEIACENGFTGTEKEWLASLAGSAAAGKSAYEIACENGFTGTEAEWLESLAGQDGQDGQNGKDGAGFDIYTLFDAYLESHDGATFEEFLHSFMVVDSYDIESAAAKAARSVVSVYSKFRNATYPTYYSCGSGVVYKQSGDDFYIITNYHVIYDYNSRGRNDRLAEEITVHWYGYSYDSGTVGAAGAVSATLVGGSIIKDIAVIKVSIKDLPDYLKTAEVEASGGINFGERVIAVGNPLGEGISVASGIISVDSEDIKMKKLDAADSSTATVDMRVIRTDTAINGGNSGGGLFNARGRLVGIVNAKTTGEEIDNMGYAIPLIVAAGIADCVIDNDSKKLALGVTLSVSSSEVVYDSAKNRIEIYETVKVESVTADGLAEGKLLKDDILVSAEIKGTLKSCVISRLFHLSDFLYKARAGDVLSITVKRGGETLVFETAAARAEHFAAV